MKWATTLITNKLKYDKTALKGYTTNNAKGRHIRLYCKCCYMESWGTKLKVKNFETYDVFYYYSQIFEGNVYEMFDE